MITASALESLVLDIAGRLMHQPAIAYQEHLIAQTVYKLCQELNLHCHSDTYGNLHITAGKKHASRKNHNHTPIYYVAHMDHPGFEVIGGSKDKKLLRIRFRGGVPGEYFREGTRLIGWPGNHTGSLGAKRPGDKVWSMILDQPCTTKPEMVVWDIKTFHFNARRRIISGRACDDLMGLTCLLAGLHLHQSSAPAFPAYGLVTRAEEVGFHGALACASSGSLPKEALFISLENSRELPPVKIGKGAIVRSGDRLSQFDSHGVFFLTHIAENLQKSDPTFQFQKALMPGGSCEATAFQHFGLKAAALCIPLGNYHNCGPDHLIAPEYVSLDDAISMSRLVSQSAAQSHLLAELTHKNSQRLADLTSEAVQHLLKFPLRPNSL